MNPLNPFDIDKAVDTLLRKVTGKNKPRPTSDEVVLVAQLHFANCGCEADTHKIKRKVGGYVYIITGLLQKLVSS